MMELLETVFVRNNLVVAFAVVGVTIWLSYLLANKLTAGRIHGFRHRHRRRPAGGLVRRSRHRRQPRPGGFRPAQRYRLDGRRHDARFRHCRHGIPGAQLSELKESRPGGHDFHLRRSHRFLHRGGGGRGGVRLHRPDRDHHHRRRRGELTSSVLSPARPSALPMR